MWVCKYLYEFLLSVLRCIPRSEIAQSYGIFPIFNFLRNHVSFSTAAAPFYTPTNSAQVSSPLCPPSSSPRFPAAPSQNLQQPPILVSRPRPIHPEVMTQPPKYRFLWLLLTTSTCTIHLWVPLKAESETKTWVKVVYLGEDPRRQLGGNRERGRKEEKLVRADVHFQGYCSQQRGLI